MFHYYFFPRRPHKTADLHRSKDRKRPQPAAATKQDKRRIRPKKRDLQHKAMGIAVCRAYSHFAALIRLCSWKVGVGLQPRYRSGIITAMCSSVHEYPPELLAVVNALSARRSVFHLKGRLLKSARVELQAAKSCGLTWRVIWQALREDGYPGGYQQFCKAAQSRDGA